MLSQEYFFGQIEKEFATAREALKVGNDGKARVCARRAAGHAITWFLSKYPRQGWGTDALRQLQNLKDDPSFPQDVREAAERLITKVSDQFRYPFSTIPLEDAQIIITHIEKVMEA